MEAATMSPSSSNKQLRSEQQQEDVPSLVQLCRNVVVKNMDKYPPEAYTILDIDEWECLVRLRHDRTQPKHKKNNNAGGGGLDGSGRMVPAISDKFLIQVENIHPLLNTSNVADEFLWKDCVEYKFRRDGLTRPPALAMPWPVLVDRLQTCGNALLLLEPTPTTTTSNIQESIRVLQMTPMNVNLLKESGIGKAVKKAIKKKAKHLVDADCMEKLKTLLNSWMDVAAKGGVEGCDAAATAAATTPDRSTSSRKGPNEHYDSDKDEDDMKVAETCQTWRQLFAALQRRNERVRNSQGKRMREIRNNLAKSRPKLVKVRPAASSKTHRAVDHRHTKMPLAPGKEKLMKIRQEAATLQTHRQKSSLAGQKRTNKSSFADAVAFAAVSKKGQAHKRQKIGGSIRQLQNGKRMKIPDQVVRGASGAPRQFASKWKKRTGTK